jgi:short subunit dehydrogenase-like uncharacterized protein
MVAAGNKSFDIVVYGATGFTGQLVAKYLAQNAPQGLRWALAGRNRQKLEDVKRFLVGGSDGRDVKDLAVFEADCQDQLAVDSFVSQTRVVLDMAGPYHLVCIFQLVF